MTNGALATYAYDASGRPTSGNASSAATSYGYDSVSRPATLTHNLAGTAADQTLTFGYNPASQIVQRTASNDFYCLRIRGVAGLAVPRDAASQEKEQAGYPRWVGSELLHLSLTL